MPRKRYLRFSLKSLFVVTVFVGLATWLYMRPIIKERQDNRLFEHLHQSWEKQVSALAMTELELKVRYVSGVVRGGVETQGSMNVTEFRNFVESLKLDKNVDAIGDFTRALRPNLLAEQQAWTTYRLTLRGGGFRFQSDLRQSTRIKPRDLRYVPQYLFTTENAVLLDTQGHPELTFDKGRIKRQFQFDPKTAFVFYSLYEYKSRVDPGSVRQKVIVQQSPKEYYDGIIWPSVYVKGEFNDGVLVNYSAYVVEESITENP